MAINKTGMALLHIKITAVIYTVAVTMEQFFNQSYYFSSKSKSKFYYFILLQVIITKSKAISQFL